MGNILFRFPIYFLGGMKGFIKSLKDEKIRSLTLGGCLCVTLLCDKEGKKTWEKIVFVFM